MIGAPKWIRIFYYVYECLFLPWPPFLWSSSSASVSSFLSRSPLCCISHKPPSCRMSSHKIARRRSKSSNPLALCVGRVTIRAWDTLGLENELRTVTRPLFYCADCKALCPGSIQGRIQRDHGQTLQHHVPVAE